MAKKNTPTGAEGNTVISRGPCRPEDYYSYANCWQPPVESILKANSKARMAEIAECKAYEQTGSFAANTYDPRRQMIREQYNREFCLQGRANRDKPTNGIV